LYFITNGKGIPQRPQKKLAAIEDAVVLRSYYRRRIKVESRYTPQCGLRPQPNLAGVTISPLLDMAA
jgi:hypothetical protein